MPIWWVGRGRYTFLILLLSALGGFFIIGVPFGLHLHTAYRINPIGCAGMGIIVGALINHLFVVRPDFGGSSLYSIPVKAWTVIMIVLGLGLTFLTR